MWGSNPSIIREKVGVQHSLLIEWCCARDGIYGDNVSRPFLPVSVWVFFHSSNVSALLS